MVMNTTVAVHEGSTQAVECLGDAISITGNVDFKWKLNGSVVKPTPASRLQILYNKMSNTRYNSTLLIPNISQRDVGKLIFRWTDHQESITYTLVKRLQRYLMENQNLK